jgi:ferredoxin-NADP reductase
MKTWDVCYIERIERAEETKSFRFERPEDLGYLPGQYFFISIPKDEDQWLLHHFSFSSSPTESHIEFTTRMRDSEYKNTMDSLAYGTICRINEIHGEFTIDENMMKVVFVCGGIGITAARSNIRWAADTESDVDIILLYANRNLAGAAFREELDELSSEHLKVVHILSKPEEGWTGPSGHINADLVRANVPDWRERHFFISGPPAMVEAIKTVLTEEVGVPKGRIKTENFLGY